MNWIVKKRLKCAVVVVADVAVVADDYVVDKAVHILFDLNSTFSILF